jgi:predicted nucleotidyltransferase
MDRDEILALLSRHKPDMQQRFGVRSLALFGSRARGQAQADSDVDLLVEFDGPASSARYFGLQFFLEDLLGSPVDLGHSGCAAATTAPLRRARRHPCLSLSHRASGASTSRT